MNTITSPDVKKAIDVARANHWRFTVTEIKDEWVYERVDVPQVGKDRIDALRAAGVPIKGFVIGHEAPRLLPAPQVQEKVKTLKPNSILPVLGTIGAVVQVLATGLLWFFALVFQVIALDPALIVELEDGTWLEVMKWYE